MRRALLTRRAAGGDGWYAAGMQIPRAESYLTRNNADAVIRLARRWAGPDWPDAENEQRMREAFQLPGVAHSSLEYYRWAFRSLPRPDGMRFARAMRPPVSAPVLALHGDLDRCLLPETRLGLPAVTSSARTSSGVIPGAGHFLHEEAPDAVAQALVDVRASGPAMTDGDRDRDPAGRARNSRPRDDFGRPLPYGAARRTRVPDDLALPPVEAVAEAQRYLDEGHPFQAHEVLEASWKAAPPRNAGCGARSPRSASASRMPSAATPSGASTLLAQGPTGSRDYAGSRPYGIGVDRIAREAAAWAQDVTTVGPLRLTDGPL